MVTRRQANAGLVSAAILAGSSKLVAAPLKIKQLPPPRATGGKPLIDALKLRRSIREYADRPLPPQVLSDLPKQHRLEQHLDADIRAQTGTQDFVGAAPLNLVYVAHGERMQDITAEDRRLYASVDAGFIGQNVYLFCASEGLATVFRGSLDTKALASTMRLGDGQFVTFAQTVGYARV